MELRVDCSQFAPNHGGGGGNFYQGRPGDQDSDKDDDEDDNDSEGSGGQLGRDACFLPANRRSALALAMPSVILPGDEEIELAAIDEDIHRSLRVMRLIFIRLERDFDRRLHVEIGDVVVNA